MKRILMDNMGIISASSAAHLLCSSDSSTLRNSGGFMLFAEGSLCINSNQPNELVIGFLCFDVDGFCFDVL